MRGLVLLAFVAICSGTVPAGADGGPPDPPGWGGEIGFPTPVLLASPSDLAWYASEAPQEAAECIAPGTVNVLPTRGLRLEWPNSPDPYFEYAAHTWIHVSPFGWSCGTVRADLWASVDGDVSNAPYLDKEDLGAEHDDYHYCDDFWEDGQNACSNDTIEGVIVDISGSRSGDSYTTGLWHTHHRIEVTNVTWTSDSGDYEVSYPDYLETTDCHTTAWLGLNYCPSTEE
jgi:hypothetical protein